MCTCVCVCVVKVVGQGNGGNKRSKQQQRLSRFSNFIHCLQVSVLFQYLKSFWLFPAFVGMADVSDVIYCVTDCNTGALYLKKQETGRI